MPERKPRSSVTTPFALALLCALATTLLATPVPPPLPPPNCQTCKCAGFHQVGTWQTNMTDGTDWKKYYDLDATQQEIPTYQAESTATGTGGYTDGQQVPNGSYRDDSCVNSGNWYIPPTQTWKCEAKPLSGGPPPAVPPSIFYHKYDSGKFVCTPNATQGELVTAKDLADKRDLGGLVSVQRCVCVGVTPP